MAIISYCDMVELEAAGYKLTVRAASGEEQFFSPYARTSLPAGKEDPGKQAEPQRLPKCFFPSSEVACKISAIRATCNFGANSEVICAAVATFDRASELVIRGHQFIVRASGDFERFYSPFGELRRSDFPQLPDHSRDAGSEHAEMRP